MKGGPSRCAGFGSMTPAVEAEGSTQWTEAVREMEPGLGHRGGTTCQLAKSFSHGSAADLILVLSSYISKHYCTGTSVYHVI